MDSIDVIRESLNTIEVNRAFLRNRFELDYHTFNETDLKAAQEIQKLSGYLIEEMKKAVDSDPNANPDTDND